MANVPGPAAGGEAASVGESQTRPDGPRLVLVTGIMAAGKSSVAQRLAEALPRCVHLPGDVFRRMIVSGREEMGPEPSAAALAQLRLRYRLAVTAALGYRAAGFSVIHQDTIVGPMLREVVALYAANPLHVVVLCPSADVVAAREAGRDKRGYTRFAVEQLDAVLRDGTPRLGLWLDTSTMSLEETVDRVLANLDAALISAE
jgi:chloramphenicol 3-O-phosphotransferase